MASIRYTLILLSLFSVKMENIIDLNVHIMLKLKTFGAKWFSISCVINLSVHG